MARLEDLTTGTTLAASRSAAAESVQRTGEQGFKVIFPDAGGDPGERYFHRNDERSLELVELGSPSFSDGGGDLLRLVSDASRINQVSDTRLSRANLADNRI